MCISDNEPSSVILSQAKCSQNLIGESEIVSSTLFDGACDA